MLPLYELFTMGSGLSQNIAQRCVCRGLAGLLNRRLFCSFAALVEMWPLAERAYVFLRAVIFTFWGALPGLT